MSVPHEIHGLNTFLTVFSSTPSALPIALPLIPSITIRRASSRIRCQQNSSRVNTTNSSATSDAVRTGCNSVHLWSRGHLSVPPLPVCGGHLPSVDSARSGPRPLRVNSSGDARR